MSGTVAEDAYTSSFPVLKGDEGVEQIKQKLISGHEIALLDVREEAEHATGHPLFASHLALSRLELQVLARLPRKSVDIVIFDAGGRDDRAVHAAEQLKKLGYVHVSLFANGVNGWVEGGGEPFIDVNAPSKAFGELVESVRHTPSVSADELNELLNSETPPVVVDARRFDEYHTMNIPGSTSVPGAELALRIRSLAPDPFTRVVVNCAGRTRSIIGTQSLINAGIPNPVVALRNGTIGWTLAGYSLEHGQQRTYSTAVLSASQHTDSTAISTVASSKDRALSLAIRAGAHQALAEDLERFRHDTRRTTYFLDVRSPDEFIAGHLQGFINAPGGQLVQETEAVASVRGARIVLSDDDGVRANMTAHWLAQMNWEVWVIDLLSVDEPSVQGGESLLPSHRDVELISVETLNQWLEDPEGVELYDLTTSANYVAGHIPSAAYIHRAALRSHLSPHSSRKRVLTCGSSLLAGYAAAELRSLGYDNIFVLNGGNQAWRTAGLSFETGETHMISPRSDRYARPYEGSDNPREAMQAYLEWEYGLVEQLKRDGTHGFNVLVLDTP